MPAVAESYVAPSGGVISGGQFAAIPLSIRADATWCWFSDPRAVSANGATFIGWITSNGSIGISKFDHATRAVTSFTLKASLEADDHDHPSVYIRPDGRIVCFYCKHNTENRMRYRISDAPYDISSWGAEQSWVSSWGNPTYSNPRYLSQTGKTYLHFRSWNPQPSGVCRAASTVDFVTWDAERTWIIQSAQRPYVKSICNGVDRIDFLFTNSHPNEGVASVYHCYMKLDPDGSEKFYKTDGTYIGTDSISPSSATRLLDGSVSEGWVWDIAYGSDGHPRVLFTRFISSTDHRYMFSRWDGATWTTPVEIEAGGGPLYSAETYYSGGICFDFLNNSRVYLSKKVGSFWEIQQFDTLDNGLTWVKTKDITSGSSVKNCRPFSPKDSNGKVRVLWWAGRYTTYTNYSTDLIGLVS